jgi:hypothetical protein
VIGVGIVVIADVQKDKSLLSDKTSNTQQTQTQVMTASVPQQMKKNRDGFPAQVSSSAPSTKNEDSMAFDVDYDIKHRESNVALDSKFLANGKLRSGLSSELRVFDSNDRARDDKEEASIDFVEFAHHQTNGKTASPLPAISTSYVEDMHLGGPGFTSGQREFHVEETKKNPPTPERTSPRERIMSRRERLARRQRGGTRQSY